MHVESIATGLPLVCVVAAKEDRHKLMNIEILAVCKTLVPLPDFTTYTCLVHTASRFACTACALPLACSFYIDDGTYWNVEGAGRILFLKPFVWPAVGAQLDVNDVAVAIPSPRTDQ